MIPASGEKMRGEIKSIALLHGWGGDARCWAPLVEALHGVPQSLHCIDLPGFGRDAERDWPQTEQLLADLDMQLPEDCLLVGWSLGGMLAVQLAARSHKVRALVTIAANASFTERADWPGMPQPVFESFCAAQQQEPVKNWQRFCGLEARGDRDMRSLLKVLKRWQPETIPASWGDALACLGSLDNRSILASLAIPSLHIYGAGDALVPLAAAEKMQAQNYPVNILRDTGHCPHLSRPEQVAALIRSVLTDSNSESMAPPLDKAAVARAFGRAAGSYDAAAHLQRAVCRELLGRAEKDSSPKRILDLGSGTGYGSELLRRRFPDAEIVALDIAPAMLAYARSHRPVADAYIAADAEQLPLADGSIDLVFSSFALQWCYRLPQLFAEIRRIMAPGARALVSTLIPGTLGELEDSWAAVDKAVHVNRFLPAEAWQRACTANALDCTPGTEQRVLHFDSVKTLMRELKSIGAHNVNHAAGKGLLSRERLRRLIAAYEQKRTEAGLPATYQVLYLDLENRASAASAMALETPSGQCESG
ncbi:malonyl-ACP O-methyltransferase BioC [Microbulbifer hydrolyticus]|uniref:Malonyl-[acyl-carrier protein] O-methyltransferase n=2 Tax=Microbulbifer hydrolyticus TaxID=48074 RepID=A0AA89PJ74_9GAMM|nr:malonyl-ACP O-methyltransferase BioC [Microbulbifer hydrolyticus]MBB5211338.1 malonyl-CoA O-methyltransferase [Microbulbifer hydrolyticus]